MMNFLVDKFNIFYLLWKWTVIKAICPLIKVIKSENIYYSLSQDFDFVSQKKQSLLQLSCNIYIIAIVKISDISIHNLFNFCRQTSMHYCKVSFAFNAIFERNFVTVLTSRSPSNIFLRACSAICCIVCARNP